MNTASDLNAVERKTAEDMLRATDEQLSRERIHPVVKEVLVLLHGENGNWLGDFSRERLEQLHSAILKTDTPPPGTFLRLHDAVFDLYRVCAELWAIPAARKSAFVLDALLQKIVVEQNLLVRVKRDAEFSAGRLAMAKHAIGDDVAMNPPRLGEAPPQSSFRAERMIPMRKI